MEVGSDRINLHGRSGNHGEDDFQCPANKVQRPDSRLIQAVLPLDDLSGDASQDLFADDMTDELITALAKNPSLRVISRTSVMQYKGVHRPVRDIARELGVEGILEGLVTHAAGRVHMTVQLIHAPADTPVWAETYDRERENAVELPEELAETIAKEIQAWESPRCKGSH